MPAKNADGERFFRSLGVHGVSSRLACDCTKTQHSSTVLSHVKLNRSDQRVATCKIRFTFSLPHVTELELIQSHMAQKPVLRGEVGCACVAREVSVERGGMVERGCPRRLGGWVWV